MSRQATGPVTILDYPDVEQPAKAPSARATMAVSPAGVPEADVAARVEKALAEAQQRWQAGAEAYETKRKTQLAAVIDRFAQERQSYFQRVETEVVQLALAVAKKILHREAELDPTLVRALVHIALDNMEAGPVVRIRVPPPDLPSWQAETGSNGSRQIDLVGDASLAPGDCLVETDLGAANFGIEAQFKTIEERMQALLARRPGAA